MEHIKKTQLEQRHPPVNKQTKNRIEKHAHKIVDQNESMVGCDREWRGGIVVNIEKVKKST